MKKLFWTSSNGIAAIVLVASVTYFLLMEHREHLFQALPYLILLLCPLMHVFMHGKHGGGHGGHSDEHHDSEHKAYQRGLEEGRRQSEQPKQIDNGR